MSVLSNFNCPCVFYQHIFHFLFCFYIQVNFCLHLATVKLTDWLRNLKKKTCFHRDSNLSHLSLIQTMLEDYIRFQQPLTTNHSFSASHFLTKIFSQKSVFAQFHIRNVNKVLSLKEKNGTLLHYDTLRSRVVKHAGSNRGFSNKEGCRFCRRAYFLD